MEAKIFQSGNSQAVRIPKEFRFEVTEVEIFKRGDEVVLKRYCQMWCTASGGIPV